MNLKYLKELKSCKLCSWNCKVNRLKGEKGVCRVGLPEVAYTNFTQVLKSYSITLLGCSFLCIYCNAYRISQYPDSGWRYRGYVDPSVLADEALKMFETSLARQMGVNRISFTGGEPSINTPYIEEVINNINKMTPELEMGLATNGFSTKNTMRRLSKISSYINFEIKAYDNQLHQAITGAPSKPVLKNAEWLAQKHQDKIRVFRTVVIPGINHGEIPKIASFIRDIDPSIHYRLVGFRPHFMLYYYPTPSRSFMQKLVEDCKDLGLKNVDYSGYHTGDSSMIKMGNSSLETAHHYLNQSGCYRDPRNCGICPENSHCPAVILEPWTNSPD